jgi:hypothetical protein
VDSPPPVLPLLAHVGVPFHIATVSDTGMEQNTNSYQFNKIEVQCYRTFVLFELVVLVFE